VGDGNDGSIRSRFDLSGRVAIITGGSGLLGRQHADALAELGAIPVLLDVDARRAGEAAAEISERHGVPALGLLCDITDEAAVLETRAAIFDRFGRLDILVNNAAHNPKMEGGGLAESSRLEHLPLDRWEADLKVGLTGAFLCARVFGTHMQTQGKGVIVNISSDLGLIAPDQRLYRREGLPEDQQPVKPVTYSVVKSGLIGLTRYLATYWAASGVRVNAIAPGGVFNGQPEDFVERLTRLIPMGRMAEPDEYKAAIAFLCSDASSYMTGAVLTVDGGRTVW